MAQSSQPELRLDALSPAEMATKAEASGIAKVTKPTAQLLVLAGLAGAYIRLGGIFYTTVVAGTNALPYGVQRLLGGAAFCLGLILVVVGGAELFTGNNLLVMAAVSRKLPVSRLLLNWLVVYVGNFVGAVLTAYVMFLSTQHTMANGTLGETAMGIANAKCGLAFVPALVRGIYCNARVCMAVWLCFACRSTACPDSPSSSRTPATALPPTTPTGRMRAS